MTVDSAQITAIPGLREDLCAVEEDAGQAPGQTSFTLAVCFRASFPLGPSTNPRAATGILPGRAPNRRGVHNHLGTYHAIAACNMAEVAGGMMTKDDSPRPRIDGFGRDDRGFQGQATTTVTALARLDQHPGIRRGEVRPRPVDVIDAHGTVFVTAEITMHISQKKR